MHASRIQYMVLILVIVLALIPLPQLPRAARAQSPCDGLIAPRLQSGGQARVTTTYGLSMKNEPRTGAAGAVEVTLLSFDTVVTVTGGYTCNLGYVWWPLQLPDGRTGWAAEGGRAGDYYMEPVTVGLHSFIRSEDGFTLAHYFVTPDGTADPRDPIRVPPVETTPGAVWQLIEIDQLRILLEEAQRACPDRLAGTPFEGGDVNAALKLPLPTSEYDFYPAPDGVQVVIVRHLHLRVPRCDTVIPQRVGISTVTVVDTTGATHELFPFPQHGSIPASLDRYDQTEPGEWQVYLDEVVWSPHSKYIAFVAAYRDTCGDTPCVRFHTYVANLATGELYPLGEGRHVGWTSGGEGINLFRLMFDEGGRRVARLFTMRPNSFDRQEIWLPGGAVYVSDEQVGFGFPWNASGTRVMVANAGEGEVMLFDLPTRDFTSRVIVPDLMPLPNRLAVHIMRSEDTFLWATIRGNFAVQNVNSGRWRALESDLSVTGVAPRRVRPFADGIHALVEMVDGSAYVLDIDADRLVPVRFTP